MRPLTILHTEASKGWGGQEIRIINECLGMMRRGHRVLIACQPRSVLSKRAAENRIDTVILRMGGALDIRAMRVLRNLIQDRGIDIVNTHSSKDSWCAGFAAKFCGNVKIIRTRHIDAPVKKAHTSVLLYKTLPDAVVAIGENVREHVIDVAGVSPDRVVSIPTGIDTTVFNPDAVDPMAFRKELGLSADTPLVGTVGMLRSEKGHKHLIDAAAVVVREMPDACFVIVGDVAFSSNMPQILSERITSLGLDDNVKMMGYRTDIPQVLAALNVFALPSLREAFGQVATQAMAMERPVVGTAVGGIPEQIINGRTGILVEKANADQLAQGILTLVKNPETASQMGKNGRRLVEQRFSLDAMLDATEHLYDRLLSEA